LNSGVEHRGVDPVLRTGLEHRGGQPVLKNSVEHRECNIALISKAAPFAWQFAVACACLCPPVAYQGGPLQHSGVQCCTPPQHTFTAMLTARVAPTLLLYTLVALGCPSILG
jgi:hypothetical protein